MKLYEIAADYRAALDAAADDPEAWADTLEGLDGTFEQKAIAVACYAKELDAEADAIEAEEKRLAERKKAKRSKAEGIKDYIKTHMEATGKTRIEGVEAVLAIKGNGGKVPVVIEDKYAIPLDLRVPTPMFMEPDKEAIRERLEAGQPVEGAHLGERGKRLVIT